MTDRELIAQWQECKKHELCVECPHFRTNCFVDEAPLDDTVERLVMALDRIEVLEEAYEWAKAKNAELDAELQKEICKCVETERERDHLREAAKKVGKDTNVPAGTEGAERMRVYISKSDAVVVADYAADEHPYDKNPEKPETFSEYNQGWHDACDYIREQLENTEKADVASVQRGKWVDRYGGKYENPILECSVCGNIALYRFGHDCLRSNQFTQFRSNYCPHCGAYMGGADNGERKSGTQPQREDI